MITFCIFGTIYFIIQISSTLGGGENEGKEEVLKVLEKYQMCCRDFK